MDRDNSVNLVWEGSIVVSMELGHKCAYGRAVWIVRQYSNSKSSCQRVLSLLVARDLWIRVERVVGDCGVVLKTTNHGWLSLMVPEPAGSG